MLILRITIKEDISEEGIQKEHTEVFEDVYSFTRDDFNTCVFYGQPGDSGFLPCSIWKNDQVSCFVLREKEVK